MKNASLIIALFSLLLLSNCKPDRDLVVEPQKPSFEIVKPNREVGTWQWKQTNDGGVSGAVHTPESENRTFQLSLRGDGTVTWYENYTKNRDGSYRLKDTILQDEKEITMIRFNEDSFSECKIISLNEDSITLTISNVCMVANSWVLYKRLE